MSADELKHWLDWADVIHFHNRWKRQEIFKHVPFVNKPSVIQIHSPRESENFREEVESGVPLAIIAQYHVRQWPELKFIVPNVVDIYDPLHMPNKRHSQEFPITFSFAPSNSNGKGWDDKSYYEVSSALKRLQIDRRLKYKLIYKLPFEEAMLQKQQSDYGIDEVATGSYHMSGLEYLSQGVACICHTDGQTQKVLQDLTGCSVIPFIQATKSSFYQVAFRLTVEGSHKELGLQARSWMEKYWNPEVLREHYKRMYSAL